MIVSNKRITKALIRLRGMHRLVCAFTVRKPPKTGFLASSDKKKKTKRQEKLQTRKEYDKIVVTEISFVFI